MGRSEPLNKITIKKPGLFTTIQDKGRWGYQQYGMTVAGSMDQFSMKVANLIVGNREDEAVIESTFLGPEIEFGCDEIICITGANMKPLLNKKPVLMWTSVKVSAGDILSFSGAVDGVRSYISFSRGLDVPVVMGSKSTFIRGNLGGLNGGKLAANDEINLGDKKLSEYGSYLSRNFIPIYENIPAIRVIMGPQDDYFTDEAIDVFLNSTFQVTSESDRMGYRLEGPKIEHKSGADIISDGIVFGSIQVPGHGSPIIMMSDRQTTGGYTKIATVISSDLPILAQMGPGSKLNFKNISLEESHILYKEQIENMNQIQQSLIKDRFEFNNERNLILSIGSSTFNVKVNEIEL